MGIRDCIYCPGEGPVRRGAGSGHPCEACSARPEVQAKIVREVVKSINRLRKSAEQLADHASRITPAETELLSEEARQVLPLLRQLASGEVS